MSEQLGNLWVVSYLAGNLVRCYAMQIVQKIPGRASADAAGDGHYDKVVGISCHPEKKLIASSSLSGDTTVRIWEDTN